MGSAMARNLLRAGHEVTVYNRSREKAEAMRGDGALVADSVGSVCAGAEAVLTMLADDSAVEGLNLASRLAPGALHISHSTIGTALSRRLAAAHAEKGQGFLSAPVFGRPDAAEAKRLIVVAGGDSELMARARPLFDAIGRAVFIAGPHPWQANAFKLCGNFMIASMIEAYSEALATLRKAGVDPGEFMAGMNELFQSPVYKGYGKAIVDQTFEPAGFALQLGLKDIRLALQTAEECASPMPFASVMHDQMLDAMAHGQENLDWVSMSAVSARHAGL